MSYDDWLAWADDSRLSEWVDGEVIAFMPPKELHQDVQGLLLILLRLYAEFLDLGKVIVAPFEMRLARSAREPDVLFVARDHLDRLSADRLTGPADLAIEIISEDSVTRDRRDKRVEYAEAGIPEYWIFDARPRHQTSEFLRLNASGAYESIALDADGRYYSSVLPGFWLRPAWLWQDPQPDALDCLLEIAPAVLQRPRPTAGGVPPLTEG
jgi:Uma2 family endonuclease